MLPETEPTEPAAPPARTSRYSERQQAFHWLTALLIAAALTLGWIMTAAGSPPLLAPLWEWHKTIGVLIFLVTVTRVATRFKESAPPALSTMPRWNRILSKCTHVGLFVALLLMPISGYMMSAGAGYPPVLFNMLPTPSLVPKNRDIQHLGKYIHLTAQ